MAGHVRKGSLSSNPQEPQKPEVRRRPSTSSGRIGLIDGKGERKPTLTPRVARARTSSSPGALARRAEALKAAPPRPRRGRRGSSPVRKSEAEGIDNEARALTPVPVKTVWICEAEEAKPEEKEKEVKEVKEKEEPLSSQARRRSSCALSSVDATVAWRAAAPLTVPASRLAAATLANAVVALGGADALGFSLDAVQRFDGTWTSLPPLPIARQALAAASLPNGVCALGGRLSSSCCSASAAAEFFDPGGGGCWTDLPPLPLARSYHAAAALEGRVYVLGGLDAEGRRLASVDWLDLREGWAGTMCGYHTWFCGLE
ncbi:unnamed protein product [Effrenium voratum]|nr:unnamed protein product [Effrenium voratum]